VPNISRECNGFLNKDLNCNAALHTLLSSFICVVCTLLIAGQSVFLSVVTLNPVGYTFQNTVE
jgi:hypothetical protein